MSGVDSWSYVVIGSGSTCNHGGVVFGCISFVSHLCISRVGVEVGAGVGLRVDVLCVGVDFR